VEKQERVTGESERDNKRRVFPYERDQTNDLLPPSDRASQYITLPLLDNNGSARASLASLLMALVSGQQSFVGHSWALCCLLSCKRGNDTLPLMQTWPGVACYLCLYNLASVAWKTRAMLHITCIFRYQ
jgi:hypothetical protein